MPHLSVVAFGIYPRMTSFSDPRGNLLYKQWVSYKGRISLNYCSKAFKHSNVIEKNKLEKLNIEIWRCLFCGPLFSLTVSKWDQFQWHLLIAKQVAIWSWLLLLKIETHTLNMETYWKQWLYMVIKEKDDNIELMETQSKNKGMGLHNELKLECK